MSPVREVGDDAATPPDSKRTEPRWPHAASFAVAMLVAFALVYFWVYRSLGKPAEFAIANAPVMIGPEWQTIRPAKPIRSRLPDQWLSITGEPGALAAFADSSLGAPPRIAAELTLANGRVMELKCCRFTKQDGRVSAVILDPPWPPSWDTSIIEVRLRSSVPLAAAHVTWEALDAM